MNSNEFIYRSQTDIQQLRSLLDDFIKTPLNLLYLEDLVNSKKSETLCQDIKESPLGYLLMSSFEIQIQINRQDKTISCVPKNSTNFDPENLKKMLKLLKSFDTLVISIRAAYQTANQMSAIIPESNLLSNVMKHPPIKKTSQQLLDLR